MKNQIKFKFNGSTPSLTAFLHTIHICMYLYTYLHLKHKYMHALCRQIWSVELVMRCFLIWLKVGKMNVNKLSHIYIYVYVAMLLALHFHNVILLV